MAMKILILCRRDDRLEYDRRVTMLAGFEKIDTPVEYVGADYEDLVFRYDGKQLTVIDSVSGTDVADYDALFLIGWFKMKVLDDVARAVAHYAKSKGVPFANSEAYHGRSFSKLSQLVIAATNGVNTTPFVFSMDSQVLKDAIAESDFGDKFILKAGNASRGDLNFLITDPSQLTVIDAEYEKPTFFVAQEFVPNDGDYRILVMGGKVRRVIHRKAAGKSHLNNTSQGGTATLTNASELPKEVIEDSINLARLFHREVTGIDMIMHRETGEFFFLEANNMPQLATGSYVEEKMTALDEYLRELADGSATRYVD